MKDSTGGEASGADETPAPNSSIRIVASRSSPRSHFVERRQCPACGALASDTLLRLPYADAGLGAFVQSRYRRAKDFQDWLDAGTYQLDRCGECRLVFQRFVAGSDLGSLLEDEWQSSSYAAVSARWSPLIAPHATGDAHELFTAAKVLGKPLSTLRVFDWGTGPGLWARVAMDLGAPCFGYYSSAARREHARQHGVQIATPGAFDRVRANFVNADQILEPESDPLAALSEVVRALAPDGILKLCVIRAPDIERRIRVLDWNAPKSSPNSLHPVQPLAQLNCFDWPALEALAARAGLRRIRVPWSAYGAILRVPGAVLWKQPKAVAKALARPVWQRMSRSTLYGWFVRAGL